MIDDLETHPAVRGLLDRLGLGEPLAQGGDSPRGRNHNYACRTNKGHAVFVKRLDSRQPDAARRFRRQRTFELTVAAAGHGGLRTPACLGWNDEELIVAFAWLEEARVGSELASAGEFDDALAHQAGRAIGTLHSIVLDDRAPAEDAAVDTEPPLLPVLDFFACLPLPYYTQASAASLEAWGLLQRDDELAHALGELRAEEARAAAVPSHCDLRLDQFLLYEEALYLTDWEEFRTADPARDIGSFVGEWLHRAVLEIPSKDPEFSGPVPQLSHQDIVRRGVAELDRLRTRNVAFWDGYRQTATVTDDRLRTRAAAFAGWHLLDRMFAAAEQRPKLTALDRAAAGIGRSAVLRPEKFADTLGLEA
jgi:hypothetical protein